MKIAMISSGSSIHVKKIANELVRRGHEITLYTLPNNDKLLPDLDKKIKVVKLPIKGKLGYFLNAPYIRKKLKQNPVDLINSHYASGYGTLARMVGKHPLALAVFGADVYEYPFQSKLKMTTVIKNLDWADVITSTSHVMADKVREFYHKRRQIYVTPFGVDLDRFHPVEVDKDDCFEIGIVKKIEKKYGIEYLLKAFHMLREKYGVKNSRLVIYGRGSAIEEYKALAQEMNISNSVLFKGFVQNEMVPEVFSHMDVACFPSVEDSESFGVAAVEAMACGVPVVCSDASGFTEVVENGIAGSIVPKMDYVSLCNSLYKIYSMKALERTKMGRAGIERVTRLYNFINNMNDYEKALKIAASGKRK